MNCAPLTGLSNLSLAQGIHVARILLLGVGMAFGATLLRSDDFQGATHLMPFEEDTIGYSKLQAHSPIERLQARIDSGEAVLKFDAKLGYLPSVLKELGITPTSQMLTFAKTSLQRERISPQNPRSLFFNDDAYIGFIPGAPVLEVSVAEAKLGGVFYTLEQKETPKPRFLRNDQCLECHASAKSMGVPGHLVRSFETDEAGVIDLISGTSLINHRTPMTDRWGGWYVTGKHGSQLHRGNLIGKPAFERQVKEPNFLGNITDLSPYFDTSKYYRSTSDIVALMLFEHQSHMHNFLARLTYEATIAQEQYGHLNYLKTKIQSFLKYLLFTEELALTAPLEGTSGFTTEFAKVGPRDKQGRSLRDLDLKTRLFRYPCSYLIYSDPFEKMPVALKTQIYRRLYDILQGRDDSPDFARLTPENRREILEILTDTKRDLPDFWKPKAQAAAESNTAVAAR